MKIEITIPVLNEEKTIFKKIKELDNYIEHNLQDFGDIKIIIADNGSNDHTSLIAKKLELGLKRVEYLQLKERGVGLALKKSWMHSNADIVGYMDLDLATDLVYIRSCLEKITTNEFDIVTGSRLKKGSRVYGRSWLRSFTSMMLNALIKVFFKTSFSDGMCGFKFLNKKVLDSLISNGANSDGWFFATEILVVGDFLKYRIYDLPVIWTDDQNSKVKIIKLSYEYVKSIFRLKGILNKRGKNHRHA
jgi:glycosyltransferase involved in cell wall biosynthesis